MRERKIFLYHVSKNCTILHISKIILMLHYIFSDGRSTKENYYGKCTRNMVTYQLLQVHLLKSEAKAVFSGT